jgi:hypothetical protein
MYIYMYMYIYKHRYYFFILKYTNIFFYIYIGSSVGGAVVLIILCILLVEKFDKKKDMSDYRKARDVKVYTDDSEIV